ncbi:hypothetical protein BDD12DRAFT_809589 [Trichophaea hybrida]|nr:hypothetical protein BDD12DRAFT_809589 [Trichophaea hybrida]
MEHHIKSFGKLATKVAKPPLDHMHSETEQFAAMINELRILSHATLRDVEHIARLLCLSWSTDETRLDGPCWPNMVVECADSGNLCQYLGAVSTAWQARKGLALDAFKGVHSLHAHQIAHCDLKPENILIFGAPNNETEGVNSWQKFLTLGSP